MLSGRIKVLIMFLCIGSVSCEKENMPRLVYYEVAVKDKPEEWRDSSFIVATSNSTLIKQIEAQLLLPVNERQMVSGTLAAGSKGYNTNASHEFKWHFKEDDWNLADMSIEISDGRPYSDVDADTTYWINNVKRFAPWNSYIRRVVNK